MTTVKEQDPNKKIYKKHHSFNGFVTRIQANPVEQSKRVVDLLQLSKADEHIKVEWRDVLGRVLKDLENPSDQPGTFKITQHIADEISRVADENVPRYAFHRFRYDVFPQTKELDRFPPYLQIEPTSICNFRCVFCYQSDKTFSSKNSGLMGSMSAELFKNVVDEIEGKVDFLSLASRGEPLVNKDIVEMLEYCVDKFLGLKINTNASLLTEKMCHAILAGGVNTIVFSADAAEEPLYSQMRVGGKLDKVLGNIRLFNEIKEKHYPRSSIITRVSGVKYSEQQNMDSMCQTWGELVDQIAFVAYNPWENVYSSPINDLAMPCSDLWRRMFVWYDGKVNPCDTDYKSSLSVGRLGSKSVSELWLSSQYQELRQKHSNKMRGNQEPCRRCTVV